jgi:predicted PurR-regulated permease PerM
MQFEPKVVEIDPRIDDNIEPKNDDNIDPKKDIKKDPINEAKKSKFVVPPFVKYAISALLVIILVVVFALFVIKRERENYSSAMAEIKAITDENNELKVRHTENQQLINSLNNRLQNTQHQLSEALAYKDAKQYNSDIYWEERY